MNAVLRANEARKAYEQRIQAIRADNMLSDHAKRIQLAKLYRTQRQTVDALRAEAENETRDREQELSRRVFGFDGTADPTTQISFRDALDRAEAAGRDNATDLINRARVTGDTILERVIVGLAIQKGWVHVIDAYVESADPTRAQEVRDLTDTTWESTRDKALKTYATKVAFSVPKPDELRLENDFTVDQLAASQP